MLEEDGEYSLSIRVNNSQLRKEYNWAQTSYETIFTRKDVTFTNPTTWTIAQAIVILVILLLIALFIYTYSGGPTGSLVVVDSGTRHEVITLFLRKGKRVNKFKKSVLNQVGIDRITARKGFGNLVIVEVKQADGLDAPLGDMEPGQTDHVGNAEIRYDNDSAAAAHDHDDFE